MARSRSQWIWYYSESLRNYAFDVKKILESISADNIVKSLGIISKQLGAENIKSHTKQGSAWFLMSWIMTAYCIAIYASSPFSNNSSYATRLLKLLPLGDECSQNSIEYNEFMELILSLHSLTWQNIGRLVCYKVSTKNVSLVSSKCS